MTDGCRPGALAALLLTACVPPLCAAPEGGNPASQQQASTAELTLDQALATAFENSPILAAAAADIDQGRGRLIAARTFSHNPELEVEAAQRESPGEQSTDRGVTLVQQFEIGGQRGKRARVAELELSSVEAGFQRQRRLVAASVALAFVDAVSAADLADLAATEATLAGELLGVTQRRFAAGVATQVDLNLALASTARSQRRAEFAVATAAEARSLLAESIGLDPTVPPQPVGPFFLPEGEPASLEVLVAGALERRADLAAVRQSRGAAEARLRAVKAGRIPDLALGAFYEEEEGAEIFGGVVGISLPIFQRNQGEIVESEAGIASADAAGAGLELAVRREIYSSLTRYRAARSSAERFGEQIVESLAESLALLERSFAAGKIALSDLLIIRRELIDARAEYIEATAEAWIARITLDLSVGRMPASTQGSSAANAEDPESSYLTETDR